jgi:hypothetical protein
MTSTAIAQLFVLGDLAAARGKLGPAHSRATSTQMAIATGIVTGASSYSNKIGNTVICVEDRLHRLDPRLAGGALSLALIRNFVFGGRRLSEDLRELKVLGFRLALHKDCGALKLVVGLVTNELSKLDASGYTLLSAMGKDVPMSVRKRIAAWARVFPKDYADVEDAMKVVHEIDPVSGEHNAIFVAVSEEDGVSFVGGPRLKRETSGLLAFGFDSWAARRNARRIAVAREDIVAGEALALLFTAQVLLTLGGPDLRVGLHR